MGDSYPRSVSRVYADANARLGPDWYDYDEMQITWASPDDYEVIGRLGRGRYSDVMAAVHVPSDTKCVIKALKPIKRKKIKREIKMLQNLRGGPNIISILNVARDPILKTPCIITEWINNVDAKVLYPTFTDQDASQQTRSPIRYYTYELLKALEFCHSHGVVHRDIKPLNILIDHPRRVLRLIDFGLAEFYHPGVELNTRVASRFYKAPELLLEVMDYDYSLDMWSVGATLGLMIFRKDPLFHGLDNYDQLVKIIKVLGTDQLLAFIEKYELEVDPEYDAILDAQKKKPWAKFITTENQSLVSNEAIDLLDKLLKYDFAERLTASEAMAHDYFVEVRAVEQAGKREKRREVGKEIKREEKAGGRRAAGRR